MKDKENWTVYQSYDFDNKNSFMIENMMIKNDLKLNVMPKTVQKSYEQTNIRLI